MEFSSHYKLDVWKKSIDLVSDIYLLSKDLPKEELYGLTGQLRRSAVSVPSNIAEGAARKNKKEFTQFLYIALSSLAELDTQLIIAENLGYLTYDADHKQKIIYIKQMLNGLIRSL